MSLGSQIKYYREKNNMFQSELGEALGVSAQAVSKWEKNKSEPDSSTILKICEIFGIDANTLLDQVSGELDEFVVNANRIRSLRESRGLQQKEVAINLGISQPTVSDWEAGRKVPSAKSTIKLAKFFCVSVEYLFGEDTDQVCSEFEEILYRRPQMRVLFDAAKDAPDEVLQQIIDIIEVLKNGKKK